MSSALAVLLGVAGLGLVLLGASRPAAPAAQGPPRVPPSVAAAANAVPHPVALARAV